MTDSNTQTKLDLFEIIGQGKVVVSYFKQQDKAYVTSTPTGKTVGLSLEDIDELIDTLSKVREISEAKEE